MATTSRRAPWWLCGCGRAPAVKDAGSDNAAIQGIADGVAETDVSDAAVGAADAPAARGRRDQALAKATGPRASTEDAATVTEAEATDAANAAATAAASAAEAAVVADSEVAEAAAAAEQPAAAVQPLSAGADAAAAEAVGGAEVDDDEASSWGNGAADLLESEAEDAETEALLEAEATSEVGLGAEGSAAALRAASSDGDGVARPAAVPPLNLAPLTRRAGPGDIASLLARAHSQSSRMPDQPVAELLNAAAAQSSRVAELWSANTPRMITSGRLATASARSEASRVGPRSFRLNIEEEVDD